MSPSLDRERVVRAALTLLDEVGLDGLSMRRLAEELGVQAASLYWHLRDKEQLLDLLADAIYQEISNPAPGRPWREQLESFAWDFRAVLQRHRDAAQIVTARFDGGGGAPPAIDGIVASLPEAGFTEEDATNAGSLLANYVPRFSAEAPKQEAEVGVTPLGPAERARLEFVNGASSVTIRADPSLQALYGARFDGRQPDIQVEGTTVRIKQRHGRRTGGEVVLNQSVQWEIVFRGGAVKVSADLSDLDLTSLEVVGGAVVLELTLPTPSAAVPIRCTGGMVKSEIHRPQGVPAQLQVAGGAAKLAFDESSFGAIGGDTRLHSPDYPGTSGHYDIEIMGGVAKLTVDRHGAPAPPARAFAAVADPRPRPDADVRFRFGLEVILDGLERRLAR